MLKLTALVSSLCFVLAAVAQGGEYFIEAESFQSDGGWSVTNNAKRASNLAMLGGATGKKDGVATTVVNVKDAGPYHVWVRYASTPRWRGPFRLSVFAGDRELGGAVFDNHFEGKSSRDPEVWKSFDVELSEGPVTLRLSKHENQNSPGLSRLVDCVLLTMDDKLVPNHLHFGAQTFVRFTLGDVYRRPVYLHIFADHFHAPWYQHFYLGRKGGGLRVSPPKGDLMAGGERSEWCNISPLIYQDSGAMLKISARHSYTETADRLQAVLEFATAPDEASIVRTLKIDNQPAGIAIYLPPNLLTAENRELMKTDREIAEATGRRADAHAWPTHGKRPEKFPFFVSAQLGGTIDGRVLARERKTLDYFGFGDEHLRAVRGVWHMLDDSYCNPDVAKMKARAAEQAADFKKAGGDPRQILFAELTDEPTGQPLEFIAKDASYALAFREWLQRLGKSPADLLVKDWDEVKPVTAAERESAPALYYFSQRFRTRALGDFMVVQREVLEEAYGATLPTLANFSDGAIYTGNFYAQGVDYFELLDAPDQNAIWGEDWANGASTCQCASYNIDLMRAAARRRGQTIAHHLIAHAGRKPWDVKLKGTSEAARGVKIFNNFCYGPTWNSHEGGPYFRTHLWYGKPETWTANAALVHEIGAAEDLLVDAMPAKAKTALLYSSASDVWSLGVNLAYGFDRMHTWLALAHAQVPVDIVHESQAAAGELSDYDVCYLSGRHITADAATALKAWVASGGTLWMTAGAASADEYNRPLHTLDELLPARRGDCTDLQAQQGSGKTLRSLAVKDRVSGWAGENDSAEVLSVRQTLEPKDGAEILARLQEDSPAVVRGTFGKGKVYCVGFLPGLSYIKPALDSKFALEERAAAEPNSLSTDEKELLARSANPWEFPAKVRELLLLPVREANVAQPITASVPLVDAVYMTHERGLLIPLANYMNRPIADLRLTVRVPRPIARIESAVRGSVSFETSNDEVRLTLPLDNNDFLKLYY
jgi:hypothetical protein